MLRYNSVVLKKIIDTGKSWNYSEIDDLERRGFPLKQRYPPIYYKSIIFVQESTVELMTFLHPYLFNDTNNKNSHKMYISWIKEKRDGHPAL